MFKFLRKTMLYIVLAPVIPFGLGAASNTAVMYANHGQFPVQMDSYKIIQHEILLEKIAQGDDPKKAAQAEFDLQAFMGAGYIDDTHIVMTAQTHLNMLADIYDDNDGTWSIGDMLLVLGNWMAGWAGYVWFGAILRKLVVA